MGQKYSVLVVDDQENWRSLLTELLEDDFDVASVGGYDDALKKISEQDVPFHVIVTDMRLVDDEPGNESGLTLADKINHLGKLTKTIVLTGYSSVSTAKRALQELFVYDYLEKKPANGSPFDIAGFLCTVHNAVNDAEAVRFLHDAFIAMPFHEAHDDFFDIVKTAAEETNSKFERTDQTVSSKQIMQKIKDGIRYSRMVIAYLPNSNSNVYFEIGISKAWRKEIFLVSSQLDALGRMLADWPFIEYDGTYKKGTKLSQIIKNQFKKNKTTPVAKNKQGGYENINNYDKNKEDVIVLISNKSSNEIYDAIISRVLEKLGYHSVRVWDDIFADEKHDNLLPPTIEEKISNAKLVIADLGDHDGDIFYLAGFAYALEKKHIFLYPNNVSNEKIPFDIRSMDLLRYSLEKDNERRNVRNELERRILNYYPNPLKQILFLAAEPTDQVHLRLGQEFREIQEEIQKSEHRDHIKLEMPQFALRTRDFTDRLLNTPANILHFSGHGGLAGELLFEDGNGKTSPVAPKILGDLFERLTDQIQCVILNACYSEKQAQVIAQHIEYVIGMQEAISDTAALAFSIGFYQALGAGKNFEEAYKWAKIQAGMQNVSEYDTPILWVKGIKK